MSRSTTTMSREILRPQKASRGPAYTRFVNRPLGYRLAVYAAGTRLTPNQLSFISFALSLSGLAVVVLVAPTLVTSVAAALLLAAGFVLDSADGQLARQRRATSSRGEWIDHMLDCAKIALVHLSVLVAVYRFLDAPIAWLLVPMGFLIVANVTFFGGILTDQLKRRSPASTTNVPSSLGKSLAMLPVDYGVLVWVFSLLFLGDAFLGAYTALFALNTVFLGAYLRTWYREIG